MTAVAPELPERPRQVAGLHVVPGDPVRVQWLGEEAAAAGPAVPEIALLLDRPLRGPGLTASAALRAAGTVHAALVVPGPDGAPLGWATGPAGPPAAAVDLALEAVLVEVGGVVVDSAAGAAILGHPARALAAAANLLGRAGHELEPGWTILTGPLTAPAPAAALAFHFTTLGSLHAPAAMAG